MPRKRHSEERIIYAPTPFLRVLGGIAISCFFGVNETNAQDQFCWVEEPDTESSTAAFRTRMIR